MNDRFMDANIFIYPFDTAFSLPVLTERPHPTRLFLKNRGPRQASLLGWKKSRTSLPCPVQSRSENALEVRWPSADAQRPMKAFEMKVI